MPKNKTPILISVSDSILTGNGNRDKRSKKLLEKKVNGPSFLKWAGGKKWLSAALNGLIPPDWSGKYAEAFLGSGALFFTLGSKKAFLSDLNLELITTYIVIKENPEKLIDLLEKFPNKKRFFLNLRASEPRNEIETAARFIYLNRTCWNGLYRVNKKGLFNTPFGKYKNPLICDGKKILEASKMLKQAKLVAGDFEIIKKEVGRGDWVYFDPPYITGHRNNGFLKYNKHLFSWDDQVRLASLSSNLAQNGVNVLISNADHESVISLYKDFYYYRVVRNSLIGGGNSYRGEIFEAILSNYPLAVKN